MRATPIVTAAALVACHVTVTSEITRTQPTRTWLDRPRATATGSAIALDHRGHLRFVETLVCPAEAVTHVEPERQRRVRPNLATFVVGVVATATGAIATLTGVSGDDPAASPVTWGGVALLGVGLPLAIGPWLGTGTRTEYPGARAERRELGPAPCGERSTGATAATLAIGDRTVYGRVDADGALAVPVFSWIDAFTTGGRDGFAVRAELTHGAVRRLEGVIQAADVAAVRDAFLRGAGIDARVEPLRQVPRVTIAGVLVDHHASDGNPGVRIRVQVENAGPGDVWQLRATIGSALPELDGRIVYIGHVPPRAATGGYSWVPLAPATYRSVVGAPLELTVRLADAHGVVSDQPVPWRGVPLAGLIEL
jgi:hypothetical protein